MKKNKTNKHFIFRAPYNMRYTGDFCYEDERTDFGDNMDNGDIVDLENPLYKVVDWDLRLSGKKCILIKVLIYPTDNKKQNIILPENKKEVIRLLREDQAEYSFILQKGLTDFPPEPAERKKRRMSNITQDKVLDWIGGDNQLSELLDIVTKVANKKYSPSQLRKDIIAYSEEEQ